MPDPLSTPPRATLRLDERSFALLLRRATGTLVVALGGPALVMLGLVVVLYRTAVWVDHTDRVIAAANRTDQLMLSVQTGFRGFRFANDPRLLPPYTQGRRELPPQLEVLSVLVQDNPRQSAAVQLLRQAIETWLAFIDRELAKIEAGQTPVSNPAFMFEGGPLFDTAQNRLREFAAEENQLRLSREARLHAFVLSTLIVAGVVSFVGIPGLAFWLQKLLREVNGAYRSNLQIAQERASELQVTLASIGDAVLAADAAGKITFLNPAAEGLTGWLDDDARGREVGEVFQIFHETTGAPVENPVARVLRENCVVGLAHQTVIRSKLGRHYPIEDSAAPIRDGRGNVRGVILVFRNVSGKRETERALQASERRFRFLNELNEATRILAAPEEIMAVSTRLLGIHLGVSRCAYAEVAVDEEAFTILHDYTNGCATTVGHYRLSVFGPRAAAEMRAGRTLVLNDVDRELTAETGAATFNAIGIKAIVCFPLVKAHRLTAMMAVHQTTPRTWTADEVSLGKDVVGRCWATIERARVEGQLRGAISRAENLAHGVEESAERFRLLAEVVSLQVWTAAVDGQLDYVNHECEDYFGVDPQTGLLGHAWAQFVHPDDLPGALRLWQESLANGQRYEVEFRLKGKNGAYRWFLVRAQAMRDAPGRIVKWFGTNTDTDEMKRAHRDAEQASRAKDDFIAALSHELRTPLTPVLLTLGALREEHSVAPELREQLEMMERNIALEARLIDDLLDLTSISRGKLNLRTELCRCHPLIDLAIAIVQEEARAKEIVIERDLTAQVNGIQADPTRFQQVIWNLLRNAVKFTPRQGRIVVTTRDVSVPAGAPALLRIQVSDSGVGIEPSAIEKIFLPFEQANHAGDHRFGGMGLGLAIARAIVIAHRGTISAQSDGVGRGSTFSIELPAENLPAEASAPSPLPPPATLPVPPSAAASPLRLLLVDDHEPTLQVLVRLLKRRGHHVMTATSVAEALAAAAAHPVDLVISDLGLPDGTGLELMAQLRDRFGLRGIAVTGYGMESDIAQAHAAGFVGHLTKPIDYSQLHRLLAEVR